MQSIFYRLTFPIIVLVVAVGCAPTGVPVSSATSAPAQAAEPFALVVMPDTQFYSDRYPGIFHDQTRWIADNARSLNIKYVLHVGDVTNLNNEPQWTVARKAFARLDGKVPYAIAPGNHDLGPRGNSTTRDGLMAKYFPVADFKKWPSFGGVYDKEPDSPHNSFHTFQGGGRKWLVLALEFAPRDDVLRWANEVVAAHKGFWVIVITHAYLHNDGRRYDRNAKGQKYGPHGYALGRDVAGGNDGQQMWDKLVSKHVNMRLVISGHIWTTARRVDKGAGGNDVHQMVVDYQTYPKGGGFLRVLKFSANGRTLDVEDYSPTLKRSSPVPDTKFQLKLQQQPDG